MSGEASASPTAGRLRYKLQRSARRAGQPLVEKVLQLYYALQSPATPSWARSTIVGALAYFILPIDAVPDIIPGVGYTDDLTMIAAALATVQMYITDDIRTAARERCQRWFGHATTADRKR